MPTATLKITDTQEKLEQGYHFLEENHVSFQKEKEDREAEQLAQKERMLKRYRERPLLTGYGKEMAKLRKEFREDFLL